MRASKKAQQRLRTRQAAYDEMMNKNPELKGAFHRPGSLKK